MTWSSTVYNLAYMLRLWIVALYDALAGGTTAPRSFSHAIARNVTQEPPTCRIVAAATQEERTPIPEASLNTIAARSRSRLIEGWAWPALYY